MAREYSVAEARNHLSRAIRDAETRGPVRITRRGKAAAVLISEREFSKLTSSGAGFWSAYEAFRIDDGPDATRLDPADVESLRDRSPGRDVDL